MSDFKKLKDFIDEHTELHYVARTLLGWALDNWLPIAEKWPCVGESWITEETLDTLRINHDELIAALDELQRSHITLESDDSFVSFQVVSMAVYTDEWLGIAVNPLIYTHLCAAIDNEEDDNGVLDYFTDSDRNSISYEEANQ